MSPAKGHKDLGTGASVTKQNRELALFSLKLKRLRGIMSMCKNT